MTELPDIMTANGYRLEHCGGNVYAIAYDIPDATVLCGTINPDGTYTVDRTVAVEYTDDTWTVDTRLPEITTADPIAAMTAMSCAVAVAKVIA